MRAFSRKSLVVPLVAIAGVAGCFDQSIDFSTPITAQVTFSQPSVNEIFAFDLSTVSAVQQHKSKIDSLSLQSVDLSVVSVDPSNNVTTISGMLLLRPDGGPTDGSQDVTVGSVTNLSIMPGTTLHVPGSPALDSYFMTVLKGSEKGYVILNGTSMSSGPGTVGNFNLKITLHMSMGYGLI